MTAPSETDQFQELPNSDSPKTNDIVGQNTKEYDKTSPQMQELTDKRSTTIPLPKSWFIAYMIVVHLLLLYTVIGVSHILINGSTTDSSTKSSAFETMTYSPTTSPSVQSLPPTLVPTVSPLAPGSPTRSPFIPSPSAAPTPAPSKSPTHASIASNYQLIQKVINEMFPSWLPSGMIMIWSGFLADIPAQYVLCDGTNGTPDLRDRFIIGAGNLFVLNSTGGSQYSTLSPNNIPPHYHSLKTIETDVTSGHTHDVGSYILSTESGHTHDVGSYILSTESDHRHDAGNYILSYEPKHRHTVSATTTETKHVHSTNALWATGTITMGSGGTGVNPFTGSATYSNKATNNDGGHTHSVNTNTGWEPAHTHTLSGKSELGGTHTHTLSGKSELGGTHTHTLSGKSELGGNHTHTFEGVSEFGGIHFHVINGETESYGNGVQFDVTNPYYAVFYVMKL
eukprot:275045_1